MSFKYQELDLLVEFNKYCTKKISRNLYFKKQIIPLAKYLEKIQLNY